MHLWLSLSALCCGLMLVACGPGFDEFTGGDGSRGEAQEVQVDTLLDDRVSADQGDNTDWKKFELDSSAGVTVKVWWDDPSVGAVIAIRDELGQQLKSLKHAKGQRVEALGPVGLDDGAYFVEFRATGGASVYTYEIVTGEGGGGGGEPTPDF